MTKEVRHTLRYRWFRKPLVVLQVKEIRHHCDDLNGSGYFDEWDQVIWRDATPEDLIHDK